MLKDRIDRRYLLFGTAAGLITGATPFVISSYARAQGHLRDRQIAAQYGIFDAAAMNALLRTATNGRSVMGVSGRDISKADRAMSRRFPDASLNEVRGSDCSMAFFRYTHTGDNACSAWLSPCMVNDGCCDNNMRALKGTNIVTFIEGPMNLALHSMIDQFRSHLRDARGFDDYAARNRAREIIAPLDADKMFDGDFYSLKSEDVYRSKYTKIRIRYRNEGSGYGRAVYTVRDKESGDLLFEDSSTFPLLT